jgi:transcriptional regulator with PAS, ATPase and Fis domain
MNGLEPSIELPPPPHPPLPEPATVVSAVRRIYRDAAHVARGEVSILISGESGTGKEVLARYIHAASPQRDHAFVALNCAALPRDLLEAELFGVEAGVATGVSSRPGKFELAHGGTLFLDEIGDMATETQARILRVIQEGEVFRLGGREPRPAHARLVAATNRDVESMMSSGAFRLDLYHRIADWTVLLPPLRDRQADIPNLAAHFLLSASRSQGHYIAGISRAAMTALESYDWPGNIRQLRSEMTRSALFLDGCQLLQTTHLRPDLRSVTRSSPQTLSERLEAVEREVILQALATLGENVADAATALGLSRSTLYRRMKALDIEIKQS